jgi:predicted nucleic acid-binding protein
MVAVGHKVYVETSIFSYLAARPSRDLITAANQQTTHSWWTERRTAYELYTSQLVCEEVRAGDPAVAKQRELLLERIPLLTISEEAEDLASALASRLGLPERARADAVHIAIAAVHGMTFLLTWNCTHIANAHLRPRIERVCFELGHAPPILCTPTELCEEVPNDETL